MFLPQVLKGNPFLAALLALLPGRCPQGEGAFRGDGEETVLWVPQGRMPRCLANGCGWRARVSNQVNMVQTLSYINGRLLRPTERREFR